MPVFLRWLLVDIIVMRILRHRRVRPYVDRAYPVMSRYGRRFGRRVYPPVAASYGYARRRRLSCCSGCLLIATLFTVGAVLAIAAVVNWLF